MAEPGARQLVTVDGIDGSGKSIFARRLVEALGASAALLAVDDFRRPVKWPVDDPAQELELYYHHRYDLPALDGCVRAFLAGATECSFPRFDGATETLGPSRTVSFNGVTHLVVEGVFVARLPSAAEALSVYVDITLDESRRRVLARDVSASRPLQEVTRRMDRRYYPAHERYQREHDSRNRAALLVDNGDPAQPVLRRAGWPQATSGGALTSGVMALRSAVAALLPVSP